MSSLSTILASNDKILGISTTWMRDVKKYNLNHQNPISRDWNKWVGMRRRQHDEGKWESQVCVRERES